MSDINITVNPGESVRLLTAGKYCDRNITVGALDGGDPMTTPLIVRAPTGSTVTCSKDGVTKTAVEDNGTWIFTGLDLGVWTVTASKDDKEVTGEIEIAFQNTDLAYEITLYDLGDIAEATGGWELITFSGYDMTESSYKGVVNVRGQSTSVGAYLTTNAIDLSGFKKLIYKCGIGGNGTVKVAIMPVGATSNDLAVASKSITTFTTSPTVQDELDISELSGRYRVGLILNSNGSITNAYMAYMKLE